MHRRPRGLPQLLVLFSLILFQTPTSGGPIPSITETDFRLHRNLLGKKGEAEAQDEFSNFVLPKGAQLILKTKSECSGGIPMKMRPLAALWCEGTKRTSQCMGVDLHTPHFVGRGLECVTDLVPGPSKCLLETLGIKISETDPKLEATCGVPPEDAFWLEQLPSITPVCFTTVPEVVQQKAWVDCSEGQLGKFHVSLNFTGTEVDLPSNQTYACQVHICCSPSPETKLFCFTENDPMSDTPPPVAERSKNQYQFQKTANYECRPSLTWGAGFASVLLGLCALLLF